MILLSSEELDDDQFILSSDGLDDDQCVFCMRREDDEKKFGKKIKSGITLHYFCMVRILDCIFVIPRNAL